jgi:hypothetical protein
MERTAGSLPNATWTRLQIGSALRRATGTGLRAWVAELAPEPSGSRFENTERWSRARWPSSRARKGRLRRVACARQPCAAALNRRPSSGRVYPLLGTKPPTNSSGSIRRVGAGKYTSPSMALRMTCDRGPSRVRSTNLLTDECAQAPTQHWHCHGPETHSGARRAQVCP